jgi:hypothetical protein
MRYIKLSVFLFFLILLFSPINSFCETEILSWEILVDNKYFSSDKDTNEIFKKCSKKIDDIFENNEDKKVLAKNMLFITAAEIALASNAKLLKFEKLPVIISGDSVLLGFMKYNTIDGFRCTTVERIVDRNEVLPEDIFTFTSDFEKLMIHSKNGLLGIISDPTAYAKFIKSYIKISKEGPSAKAFPDLRKYKFYELEGYLWFLKASFALKKPENVITEETNTIMKELKLK